MTVPQFDVDPWRLHEPRVDVEALGVSETVFALANGHVGMRGTLDEGDPVSSPGTYMSGVYENHPLAYPEGGYGHPEHGEAMIGVADGSTIRLYVDGVPLDVRTGRVAHHSRTLDLRAGTLTRDLEWTSPMGTPVRVRSRRLVSLVHGEASAIRYEVTVPSGAHVVVRSDLVVDRGTPTVESDDPRVTAALAAPFVAVDHRETVGGGLLVHRTAASRLSVAAQVRHEVEADGPGAVVETEVAADRVITSITGRVEAGESLVVTKFLGHACGDDVRCIGLADRAQAAVEASRTRGWEGLLADQRAELDAFWADVDVTVDGDVELQQALRFNLFVLHQASVCVADAPIGAKGLTGTGYSGHTFWDVEGFVLPALTLLRPQAAARLLRWRASTLDEARRRAELMDMPGALFAWRTISGREASAYWPASTAAIHLNADIARAYDHYTNVTGETLESVGGVGVVVETARSWVAAVHTDSRGHHFFGVTGPDEYTGVVDDNVFTNLMARRHLRIAAQVSEDDAESAAALGVDAGEIAWWREVANGIHVPFDERLGVHPMNENFTSYREWRFEDKTDMYPVQETNHYAKFYRRQVCKQADLVQAIWWCRDEFTDEQVASDVEYYEARTVRDSSLSAAVQAVACAQAGHVDLALRYVREAAMVDLRDVQENTSSGIHMASTAGAWLGLVAGLGGLREDHDVLELAPRLPVTLTRTVYRVRWRGAVLTVETTGEGTTLSVRESDSPVEVLVDGRSVTVAPGEPATVPLLRPAPLRAEPTQPAGREPSV